VQEEFGVLVDERGAREWIDIVFKGIVVLF
jgi:hypothetical protein